MQKGNKQEKNGLFIMIEGTDGSGKTVQTQALVERLTQEGYPVEHISFPQYGKPSATMVEAYLNGALGSSEDVGPYKASILFAVDRYAAAPTIREWLANGKIVIANRYVGSNMAHQGGKISDPEKRAAYLQWNHELEYDIFGIPKPDVNLILHVTPEISQKLVDKKSADERGYITGEKTRDIHEDDLDHLRNAEQAYLAIAEQFPEFKVIECTKNDTVRPIPNIHADVWQLVQQYLP